MAYQKKYFVEFKTLKPSSETHVLELWQDTTDVLVAEELKGGQSPFIVELPELSHKFQVVRGTGGNITLLSDTDMKLFAGLQHVDFKEFKVIHYINSVLNWIGYLNADMQSEPYDIDFNYIVTTTANDGFALLDRYKFLQNDETKYVGIYSKWELLQICLNKIGLSYTDIRVKLATTFTGFSAAADSTILHESFVNCANFYDEDDEAMTLRELLESILAPYGAFIIQSSGSIYITDIHTMAGGGTVTFQKFNASTYAYVSTVNYTTEKNITAIGYFGTGHSIERSGGTNQQRVIYSPYPQKEVLPQSIVTPDEFSTVPATFSDKDGYKYRTLTGHTLWSEGSPADFEESCLTEDSEHFIYARLPMIINDIPLMQLTTPAAQYLSISDAQLNGESLLFSFNKRYQNGAAILITGKILAKTNANPYTDVYTSLELLAGAQKLTEIQTNVVIQIGDYYYNQSLDSFTTTFNSDTYIKTTLNDERISNKWVEIGENGGGFLIPIRDSSILDLYTVIHGNFNLFIYSNTKIRKEGGDLLTNNSLLDETWIRDLKVSIVNLDGSEIEDYDNEYLGKLNKLFAQEGEEITLKCGSMGQFADKGKILRASGDTYADMIGWTRDGQTFKIEELLLNSLCSNYRMNFITLLGMNLKNEFGFMNVLTDSAYLGIIKMMVKSATFDYANYVNSVNLVEISEDELTIVKE